ncbi:hypothetical protein CC80DRAFT_240184 [Byssothecium circinans]|uniref:Uncharacterized protein n=1 Tax=Byssothecium circinans TaxID=147558 RepID=A0A6A5TDJ3_9PLEO|nr:hypothetical protein CC80DRAFT_240184 [Byssothecium circinans]
MTSGPPSSLISSKPNTALPVSYTPSTGAKFDIQSRVELSPVEVQLAQLRAERDHWHSKAIRQRDEIHALKFEVAKQSRTITRLLPGSSKRSLEVEEAYVTKAQELATQNRILTCENAILKFHNKDYNHDLAEENKKLTRENVRLGSRKQGLTVDLARAERTIQQLKKSDRAKGKIVKRDLLLKAVINTHMRGCGGQKGKEDMLMEALALAVERVEELEVAGEEFLDALDDMDDMDSELGDGDGDGEDEDERPGLLGAELRFRGVIEDDAFRDQKTLWGDLLD